VAPADEVLRPLGTGAAGAHWVTQAIERYLHMAWTIMTRAATWPASEAPFPPQALELARQLYEAIEHRVDELGRAPLPDVPCADIESLAQNSEKQRRGPGWHHDACGDLAGRRFLEASCPACEPTPRFELAAYWTTRSVGARR
jgi:hypothetical protein